MTPSLVVASVPPPLVRTGLKTSSTAEVRSSAQQILWYLETLKDVEADHEDNRSSFTASGYLFFCWLFPFVCIALTVRLEAAEKALAEERIAQLAADQPLAKERVARMVVD
jgi:hypothetical protein